jgi:hypothetical protein
MHTLWHVRCSKVSLALSLNRSTNQSLCESHIMPFTKQITCPVPHSTANSVVNNSLLHSILNCLPSLTQSFVHSRGSRLFISYSHWLRPASTHALTHYLGLSSTSPSFDYEVWFTVFSQLFTRLAKHWTPHRFRSSRLPSLQAPILGNLWAIFM